MSGMILLNAYPDSVGGRLSDIINTLKKEEFKDTFNGIYILPSLFESDLDRGFSVISYDLNEELASPDDIIELQNMGVTLKLDFVLNHLSVNCRQFQDIIKNGQTSEYADFFINWNKFWYGYGKMTDDGYIQPDEKFIRDMFFRKPGLPILTLPMPDGSKVPYWNTFYQEIIEEGKSYLGQMDLNIKSPLVWDYYEHVLKKLAGYGAKIVRLDAFAYAPKTPGAKNFLNEPDTWELLTRVANIADKYNLRLLPEIHANYEEKIYKKISDKGYMTYDFFLPGLIIDAIENKDGVILAGWINELAENNIKTVNMLGCHDGIPLLDLKGLVPEERIKKLIDIIVDRGGYVKDLHGAKNMYYQVNATYYSALGEDDKKMLLARAIQMFMPGIPQVWYLDLFAGKNDYEAVAKAGPGGHKEINRTNLGKQEIDEALKKELVLQQLNLIRMRRRDSVFLDGAKVCAESNGSNLVIIWKKDDQTRSINIDFDNCSFKIL